MSPNDGNISRSGRVRKKSSKLQDFQSPDENKVGGRKSSKKDVSASMFDDPADEEDSDMEDLDLEADIDIDLDQFDVNFEELNDLSELDLDSTESSGDYSNRAEIIKKPDNLPQVQSSPKISPFLLWAKHIKPQVLRENPGMGPPTLRIKLAQTWNTVPKAEKLTWSKKAKSLLQKNHRQSKSPGGNLSTSDLRSPLTSPTANSRMNAVRNTPELEPINIASHLKLLGESLSTIGERLREHEGQIAVSGSLSVLLDSLLCAMGPLVCLTARVPELNGAEPETLNQILDNVAYIMPGL